MTQDERQQHFQGRGILAIWAGWLLAPLAWAVHENVSFFGIYWVCTRGPEMLLHLASLATLAVAIVGLVIAWRSWKRAGGGWTDESEGSDPVARSRFLSLVGVLISAISVFGIIAESIPIFLIDPCLGLP